jgi:hypothetical protein
LKNYQSDKGKNDCKCDTVGSDTNKSSNRITYNILIKNYQSGEGENDCKVTQSDLILTNHQTGLRIVFTLRLTNPARVKMTVNAMQPDLRMTQQLLLAARDVEPAAPRRDDGPRSLS